MEFKVLGDIRIIDGGRDLYLGTAGKRRLLLAGLLSRPAQTCSVDWLVDLLWEDSPPASARRNLRQYIHQLRLAMGGGHRLPSRPGGYALEVGDELDSVRFARLVAEGRDALSHGRSSVAAGLLRSALDLWQGNAFGEFLYCDQIAGHAGQLERMRLNAQELWARAELDQAGYGRIVLELPELVRAQPYQESLSAILMVALYGCGRRSEALEVFEQARAVLRSGLGVEPGEELARLHTAILNDDRTQLARPAAAEAGAGPPIPHELPADIADFTGRIGEIKRLDELAQSGADGLAITVITGMGGVGKTALAVRWAHRAAHRFPDGQLYARLHGGDSDAPLPALEVLRDLLLSLGVSAGQVPAHESSAASLYRSLMVGRRALVILDNAVSADQVRPLLPGSPGCVVIVTSRSWLGGLVAREGARRLSLDVLPEADAGVLLVRMVGHERVADEPEAVAELARACGFLPLALRIAAANLVDRPRLRIAGYVSGLRQDDRLSALAVVDDELSSMRAVLSHSYVALSPAEQRLFRLLGLMPGNDFGAAAVAALAGDGATAGLLHRLTEVSLLGEHRLDRFTMHELVRDHAAERAALLEAGERETALRRVFDHYSGVGTHAALILGYPHRRVLEGSVPVASVDTITDRDQAAAWFAAEHTSILAALERAAADGLDRYVLQLAWTLTDFLDMQGSWPSTKRIMGLGLQAATRSGHVAGQAFCHRILGRLFSRLRDFEAAHAHMDSALRLLQGIGDAQEEAYLHIGLATLNEQQSRWPEAAEHAELALARFEKADARPGLARALNSLGWIRAHLRDFDTAERMCVRSVALHESLQDRRGTAMALDSLGFVYQMSHRYGEAIGCYSKAAGIREQLGVRYFAAASLIRLGEAEMSDGRRADARRSWHRALAILEQLNHPDADAVRARLE